MTTTQHIIHELPVPQSVQDLRAACGLPAVTVRHGDQVHQFAYTTQPEYVTCVGCLAVREVAAARHALGEGWLTGGVTLAQGIALKMRALEGLEPCAAAAWKLVDAVQAAHHDDVLPRFRDLAGQAIAAALAPPDLTPADPMLPTVAVPRELVEAIVDDLREGLALERETVDALAELLGGGL